MVSRAPYSWVLVPPGDQAFTPFSAQHHALRPVPHLHTGGRSGPEEGFFRNPLSLHRSYCPQHKHAQIVSLPAHRMLGQPARIRGTPLSRTVDPTPQAEEAHSPARTGQMALEAGPGVLRDGDGQASRDPGTQRPQALNRPTVWMPAGAA